MINEFESLSAVITDEKVKGLHFRRLLKEELYPQSATMPRKKPYKVMKCWFLKVAWSKRSQKAHAIKVCAMTQDSTGKQSAAGFLLYSYLHGKLRKCEVSRRDIFIIITQKAPFHIVRSLTVDDFESPVAFNNDLSRIEHRVEQYKLNSSSEGESTDCLNNAVKAVRRRPESIR